MSTRVTRGQDRVGVVPGMPDPVDLADLWLAHALSCLLDACDVPLADRRGLIETGAPSPELAARAAADNAEARIERFDASRLAVLFAALAVEARLDRLLRQCDAADWPAVAHLAPAERFRIAPRLLDGLESATADSGLYNLAVDLFNLRDELVDAVGRPGAALTEISSEFSPSRTRAMVSASAKICDFLATLAHEVKSGTAHLARETADALTGRADAVSAVGPPRPELDRGWSRDIDFPPDMVAS